MRFACPKCGRITSSSLSLETGGYWNRYSRSGPWGCVSCRTALPLKCECGCVGTAATILNGKCPMCRARTEADGKKCVLHPDVAAKIVCPKCGRPACDDCFFGWTSVCRVCEGRDIPEWFRVKEEERRLCRESQERTMESRRRKKRCEMCGEPLGFVDRLFRRFRHAKCSEFAE